MMNYKKIFEYKTHRYYKFSEKLIKDVRGNSIERPTEYVVVSDAHTHIERQVFPAYITSEEDLLKMKPNTVEIDFLSIAGEMTMMIHGGDPSTVRPDEEYLNELLEANTHSEAKGQ